jgi:hypothetical protein
MASAESKLEADRTSSSPADSRKIMILSKWDQPWHCPENYNQFSLKFSLFSNKRIQFQTIILTFCNKLSINSQLISIQKLHFAPFHFLQYFPNLTLPLFISQDSKFDCYARNYR